MKCKFKIKAQKWCALKVSPLLLFKRLI
uniref:Uncharacterized protein n=1 Tax=Arundo donax TaxID=35708 RepID=A0A0A8Y271_ARUDO